MKPAKVDQTAIGNAPIDRILAAEEEIVPSSGFLASVMERVSEEAAAPLPIPFPWRRIAPGMVLAAAVLGWGGYELASTGLPAVSSFTFTMPHLSAAMAQQLEPAGWVSLALGASLFSWLLARRLAGRSGLL